MNSTKLIKIDSANRTSGSNEDFTYILHSDVNTSKLSLVYASIPNTSYNITTAVSISIGASTISVPVGQYTVYELCSQIQSSLQATDVNFTCSFNPITFKVTIARPTAFALDLTNQEEFAKRIGFEAEAFASATSHVSSKVPVLIETCYYINVSQAGQLGVGSAGRFFTFVVPNTATRGNYSIYLKNNNFSQDDTPKTQDIYSFQVELRNEANRIVDLNGAPWSLVLSTGN